MNRVGSFDRWQRWCLPATAAGLVALGVGAVLAPARALTNLLIGAIFTLSLAIGGVLLSALMTVGGAGWSTVVKRVFEGFASFVPAGAALLLATLPGLRVLYEWARPEAAHDHLLGMKTAFLNGPFFALRMATVLGLWVFFARKLRGLSLAQDAGDGVEYARKQVRWSAGFLVVFAISFCLAAFDWLMSLEARWFSTIFGLYNIAGVLASTTAAVAIASILLKRSGLLPEVRAPHLHDLGKLMFGFATLWAYLWLSQFLLIWYSNLPEETIYFSARWKGGWAPVFWINLIVNWALPFVLLLPRPAKRSETHLLRVGALMLFGRWLDLWLMAMPGNFAERPWPSVFELAGLVGPLALFAFVVSRTFQRVPLLPKRDPYLEESLHLS